MQLHLSSLPQPSPVRLDLLQPSPPLLASPIRSTEVILIQAAGPLCWETVGGDKYFAAGKSGDGVASPLTAVGASFLSTAMASHT